MSLCKIGWDTPCDSIAGGMGQSVTLYYYIDLSKDRDYLFSKVHKTKDPNDWTAAKSLRNRGSA